MALKKIGGFIKIKNCPTADLPTWFVLATQGNFYFNKKYLGFFRRHQNATSMKLTKKNQLLKSYITLTKKYFSQYKSIWRKIGIDVKSLKSNQLKEYNKVIHIRDLRLANNLFETQAFNKGQKVLLNYLTSIKKVNKFFVLALLQYICSFFSINLYKILHEIKNKLKNKLDN